MTVITDVTDVTDDETQSSQSSEKYVQKFTKQMLQTRLFMGHFQERRFVDFLQTYRDVVMIAESETQLKSDLDVVRKKLKDFYANDCWIGMTTPDIIGAPNGHCLWVESQNTTFGSYWYTIKSIRYFENEVLVRLKTVRPVSDSDQPPNEETIQSLDDIREKLANNMLPLINDLFNLLTLRNIADTLAFTFLLLGTCITLMFKGISFLMEFLLKFMHETSFFVQSATPVMIAFINMLCKIVGGFYILIAMLWRGKGGNSYPGRPIQSNYKPAILMPDHMYRR